MNNKAKQVSFCKNGKKRSKGLQKNAYLKIDNSKEKVIEIKKSPDYSQVKTRPVNKNVILPCERMKQKIFERISPKSKSSSLENEKQGSNHELDSVDLNLNHNQLIEYDINQFHNQILDPDYQIIPIRSTPTTFDNYFSYFKYFNSLRVQENRILNFDSTIDEHATIISAGKNNLSIFIRNNILMDGDIVRMISEYGKEVLLGIVIQVTSNVTHGMSHKSKCDIKVFNNKFFSGQVVYVTRGDNVITKLREYTALIELQRIQSSLNIVLCKDMKKKSEKYKGVKSESPNFELINSLISCCNLNKTQATGIASVYASKEKLFLFQGPPGTGKTTTICGLLTLFLFYKNNKMFSNKPKILICAPSNTAIDHIVKKLSMGIKDLEGNHVELEQYLVRLGYSNNPEINNDLQNKITTPIITCSTLGSCVPEKLHNIDYLIVDEACQATELSTLVPLQIQKLKKIVLIGDPKQLPLTVMSNNNLTRSLFERISAYYPPFLLNVTSSMNDYICKR